MSAEDCLPVNVELLQTLYVQYVRACSVLDCTCVLQSSTHVHSNMSGLISGVHGHFALCRNAALILQYGALEHLWSPADWWASCD